MALPGPRGGLSIVTDPAHFPTSFNSLVKKTTTDEKLKAAGLVSGDTYVDPVSVGSTEGFTIYVKGSGSWNVQVGPNIASAVWINHESSDKSGDGFVSISEWHNYARVVVRAGSNLEIWIYKKYASY